MILIDANLLIYAHVSSMPQHKVSAAWLDRHLNETSRVGLPWQSLLAFVRIVSNPRVFSKPLSPGKAFEQVLAWLELENVWTPGPTEKHAKILEGLLAGPAGASSLVPDAHLAALAMEHGLTLCSSDGDFYRFSGLRIENPLK
jgi:toxin-antitoxin system PIN domain toxin